MSVRILFKRKVSDQNITKLTTLLKTLRSLAIDQPGYICGETLKRADRADESLVVSTWRSVEDWDNWVENEKRMTIQSEIDRLLGWETEYAVYDI